MSNLINLLTKTFQYKQLPLGLATEVRAIYKSLLHIPETAQITNICSKQGTLIATSYTRVVIGDYGAFIEIDKSAMIKDNIKCEKGQEYRFKNPSYKTKVKYFWYTTKDTSSCKIYYQQRTVSYADYKTGFFYISPDDVILKKSASK